MLNYNEYVNLLRAEVVSENLSTCIDTLWDLPLLFNACLIQAGREQKREEMNYDCTAQNFWYLFHFWAVSPTPTSFPRLISNAGTVLVLSIIVHYSSFQIAVSCEAIFLSVFISWHCPSWCLLWCEVLCIRPKFVALQLTSEPIPTRANACGVLLQSTLLATDTWRPHPIFQHSQLHTRLCIQLKLIRKEKKKD